MQPGLHAMVIEGMVFRNGQFNDGRNIMLDWNVVEAMRTV
jgi:hypothetical protein